MGHELCYAIIVVLILIIAYQNLYKSDSYIVGEYVRHRNRDTWPIKGHDRYYYY